MYFNFNLQRKNFLLKYLKCINSSDSHLKNGLNNKFKFLPGVFPAVFSNPMHVALVFMLLVMFKREVCEVW